jgi:flavin-dependent dehydrogenase
MINKNFISISKLSLLLAPIVLASSICMARDRGDQSVVESARDIPLVYDVDVIVIGGATRGVAAAVAAADAGAKVFLAAERPYLGEDICATYRLWLEKDEIPKSDLAKALFLTEPAETKDSATQKNPLSSPMQVKRALDQALLNAGVKFLYGSYVSDVIVDHKGKINGVTITNRSGRQAVRGKVIIDASDRAVTARQCGAVFKKYPKGPQNFSWIVIGGRGEGQGKALGHQVRIGSRTLPLYEYSLEIDMNDGSWTSFAKADEEARNRTWRASHVTSSERLHQVPPDPLVAKATQAGPWQGADALNLDTLRPADVDNLYVLGGCAAVSREAAAVLMRPLAGMRLGTRVGTAAAAESKTRGTSKISYLRVAGQLDPKSLSADVGEMLQGVRSMAPLKAHQTINNPSRSIPVIGRYDTVVVGGGTGGASAGIGAARGGAKTLVIEYLYGLGGVGTIGRVANYYHGNNVGFSTEMDAGVKSIESDGHKRSGWNIEHKMEWLRSEVVKAGGDVWFRSLAVGSIMDGKRCIGVMVSTPHGRAAVLANTVIDSTGNSVIPACAGMATQAITGEHISVQGTGLPQQTPGESYYNSDWTFVDDDDVLDMWRIMVVGRSMVGRSNYRQAFDLGQLIDTRARRRIVGDLVISPMDIVNARTYPDTITISKSNFDNHGFSSHDMFMVTPPHGGGLVGHVPYRALLPKGVDGLLVTGLGLSAHGDAMPVLRMQRDVQNQGYAAGKASAMAAEKGATVRKIDVKELQRHLVQIKIIPESALTHQDSYPITAEQMKQAVESIGVDYSGISKVLTDVSRALPMLRKAYGASSDEAEKLRYAHVLGMLYDDAGADALIAHLSEAEWDKGWNFTGLGQYGATTSYIDNLIIALGRTKSEAGLDVILKKVKQLENLYKGRKEGGDFSHCRAVAMALESIGDERAAYPLMRLMKEGDMVGHSFLEINDVILRTGGRRNDCSTRNASLQELILARALYRCGDYEGLGKSILTTYSQDYRGHYSRHAKAILQEDK